MVIDLINPVSGLNYGGVERYALNLLRQFAKLRTGHSFRLVNFPPHFYSLFPFGRLDVKYHFRNTVSHLLSRRWRRLLLASIDYLATNLVHTPARELVSGWNRQVGLSLGLDAAGPSEITHGLTHFLPRYARPSSLVGTVHDVGPLRVSHLYPRAYVEYMRYEFARQVRQCEKVIVVSPFTLREVHELYHVPQERLVLIPQGVDETFRPMDPSPAVQHHGITTPYVFYPIGTIEPRKNLAALSEAVRRVRADLRIDLMLLVSGRSLGQFPEVERVMENGIRAGYIRNLGYVDDSELPALYCGAELCVYPSLYEGFGLPVLEAMACGAPVAISRVEPLEYVAGEAAYRFKSHSVESITAGIHALITDPGLRSRLREAGLRRARSFDWETTARRTLETYDSLV